MLGAKEMGSLRGAAVCGKSTRTSQAVPIHLGLPNDSCRDLCRTMGTLVPMGGCLLDSMWLRCTCRNRLISLERNIPQGAIWGCLLHLLIEHSAGQAGQCCLQALHIDGHGKVLYVSGAQDAALRLRLGYTRGGGNHSKK
jgi:hypothetical protein